MRILPDSCQKPIPDKAADGGQLSWDVVLAPRKLRFELDDAPDDDFEREIQSARSSESFMTFLRLRSKHPATISLQDLKAGLL
jgi:hypothetical protein